ncbi:MAG TPA: hypothetical protein VFL91_16055 [Thermomicrobiales bacterium]|nr:hypothetical protein [Thermomicrobiales bacterium]
MNEYMLERLARLRHDELLREAAQRRQLAQIPRRPSRERLAGALVALATWLAPASEATTARKVAKTGQPA